MYKRAPLSISKTPPTRGSAKADRSTYGNAVGHDTKGNEKDEKDEKARGLTTDQPGIDMTPPPGSSKLSQRR